MFVVFCALSVAPFHMIWRRLRQRLSCGLLMTEVGDMPDAAYHLEELAQAATREQLFEDPKAFRAAKHQDLQSYHSVELACCCRTVGLACCRRG